MRWMPLLFICIIKSEMVLAINCMCLKLVIYLCSVVSQIENTPFARADVRIYIGGGGGGD